MASLRISQATAHKISTVHGVQADEVKAAVQFVSGLRFTWDEDPDRGRRAIVAVRIRGKSWKVVLYPDRKGRK